MHQNLRQHRPYNKKKKEDETTVDNGENQTENNPDIQEPSVPNEVDTPDITPDEMSLISQKNQ